MPSLDVTELLADPDFCEAFTVTRRQQVIDQHGRASTQNTTLQCFGSIQSKDTAIGGNTIEREPNMEYRGAAIDVYTTTPLYGPQQVAAQNQGASAIQYMPDLVYFNGDPFLVVLVNDYTHYGAGFVHAECTSIPSVDTAPS